MQYNNLHMCYVIRGLGGGGLQVSFFDHLYFKKEKYFEKQYTTEDARNLYLDFCCIVNGLDKEIKTRP